MPQISRFFGIIITMYWEIDAPHHTPHFHVRYNEYQASYGIDPVTQIYREGNSVWLKRGQKYIKIY